MNLTYEDDFGFVTGFKDGREIFSVSHQRILQNGAYPEIGAYLYFLRTLGYQLAVPVEAKKARYHGFTCPDCGSHYFGTSNWKGVLKGHCHGDQHTGNGCKFTWDRSDKAAEDRCLYTQTAEEWSASYVAPDDNAEMLRKDAEGFASAKPYVKPTPAPLATPTPHACIAGLTRVAGLSHLLGAGVR